MKNCTKVNLDFLRTDNGLCAKVPYNGVLFNSVQMISKAELDNMSLNWPKKNTPPREEKELGFDLNFYLSISG